jgi:hypothetical protein
MKKSDIDKWNSSLIKFKSECQQIMSLSKSIRYVGIINEYGRTLAGKIKPGIKPLFSPNQVREEFFTIATSLKLREKSTSSIGKFNYTILDHEKTVILLIQNKKIIYYITFEPKTIPSKLLIKQIKSISIGV